MLSVGGATAALAVIPASSADATLHAGEFCAPKGATYRTPTATLICAPALLTNGRKDSSYRWSALAAPAGPRGGRGPAGPAGPPGPACPSGYAQQLIQVQAIPAGATDPVWAQVMASIGLVTPTSTPTSTVASGLDPRFPTCADAKAAGYGPYHVWADPEYWWYTDMDHDGVD
jgi:hypothetical protein